jgi:RNA polymerase sigma-70 factor (ECF subfamily)
MVSTLPLGDRTILSLREIRDLDLHEIAAILAITPGAAKIRLHRARRRLRQRMEEGCRFLVDDRGELQCDPKVLSPGRPTG